MLTTREYEGRTAIATCERFVYVLHADSRKKEVVEVIAKSNLLVGAPRKWKDRNNGFPGPLQRTDRKAQFPATRQYTRTRQAPLEAVVGREFDTC